MIGPDGVDLGECQHEQGKTCICEKGICDKKKSFLWEDIDTIFISGVKEFAILVPKYEFIDVTVNSKKRQTITLKVQSLGFVNRSKKEKLFDAYNFILSNIIDRQLKELTGEMKKEGKINFGSFELTPTAVYRKKMFGGRDVIEIDRITGCGLDNGEFVIEYLDDNGRVKQKKSGFLYEIPNLHIAQTFLLSISQDNNS
jgi:hypothetical protein